MKIENIFTTSNSYMNSNVFQFLKNIILINRYFVTNYNKNFKKTSLSLIGVIHIYIYEKYEIFIIVCHEIPVYKNNVI